jgi:HSF-type DNA-binding
MLVETFHMIDTCDPAIAGWAEDGLTFIVKDPEKFETNIIPQFFKHSKFTSFVRVSMKSLNGRVH